MGSALSLSSLQSRQKSWAFLRECCQSSERVSASLLLVPLRLPLLREGCWGGEQAGSSGVVLPVLGGRRLVAVLPKLGAGRSRAAEPSCVPAALRCCLPVSAARSLANLVASAQARARLVPGPACLDMLNPSSCFWAYHRSRSGCMGSPPADPPCEAQGPCPCPLLGRVLPCSQPDSGT